MNNYKLYESNTIKNNYNSFIEDCKLAHHIIKEKLETNDTTWTYSQYNLFTVSATSTLFYDLFKELKYYIRDYVKTDNRLWMQSWINMHRYDEVLDWHNHQWSFHGYICVDPKDSVTEFDKWTIKNKPGQIYIGPGYHTHRVVPNSLYEGKRITIGFDVTDTPDTPHVNNMLIPLI